VVEELVEAARRRHPGTEFLCGDVLDLPPDRRWDYVVCNGILTQKLESTLPEMDAFAHDLLKRMYQLCAQGIAFNVMSSKANYFAPNLYYRDPSELMAFCFQNLGRCLRLDHSYPLYEYTIYVSKRPWP
jgi:hypothetical protein